MKTLNSYTEKEFTALLEAKGAFYAFGKAQFDQKKVEGVTYVDMGLGGLLCPKENAQSFYDELNILWENGKKQFLAENKLEDIIRYELVNHECYYIGDWMPAFEICEDYGATKEMVQAIYRAEAPKQYL